ncbi:unnamed protein product [Nippostrongylus brasiliensis]|uniref:GOLD domain-containing protein n=1 Tax=Nippostrongylus brasiliensis TaxID=27835 RepID=A0A0N4XD91_NIPBR|nr:unnamed protein product [Nippostrongylus brasiliensis]
MYSLLLSAAILTTIFAINDMEIDFKDCIRSSVITTHVENDAMKEKINKRIPAGTVNFKAGTGDTIHTYSKLTKGDYVFVKLDMDGNMTAMLPDINGELYNEGFTKCVEYSNATINNDEPPYNKSTAEPESTLPVHVRRKTDVDL